uniref:probable tubulin polyglutamylase TTLL2 n=1 Tax=Centroberyx gerrardi TaxID=166262 RepID=UPI003AAFB2A0
MAASLVFRLHDGGPELVREVLLERGWEEYDKGEQEEEDWNLYWRASAFRNSEYHNLLPWQRLNHHPKTVGITRKDCLARNLRRMRSTFGSTLYNFSPTAFILPNDYTRFLSEYTKERLTRGLSAYWICKPVDLSRGRGIFIFEDIKDLVYDSSVIIQRYISNPLLISGYKFDLRIYVCVKSFHPLTVYMHQEGLVRFATEKYNLSSLNNLYAHLTNTSINKFGPFYTTNKERVGQGCKWTMSKFRYFLHSQGINELLLWQRINNIVTLTLLTIAPSVPSSPNCVELFGFDILIDSKFKPWLLEVNYSPALTLDCQADVSVKKGLISDLIDLMNYRSIDSLRERAYQGHKYKQPCYQASQASQVSTLVLSKFKELKSQRRRRSGSQSSQTQTLPLLKVLCQHQPHKISQSQFRQHALVAGCQKYLDLNRIPVARGRIIHANIATATKTQTHTDRALNPILGPHSRTTTAVVNRHTRPAVASCLMDNRALYMSEVTNHDDTETEMEPSGEAYVCSAIPDIPQLGLGSLRSKPAAGSWKLPNIHRYRPVKLPLEGARAPDREKTPPLRVGDFILTFPFNKATLKASQNKLDVKLAIQELHKLTGQLASGSRQSDKKKWREEDMVKKDEGVRTGEEDFESLFWGPKDPLLLSQCCSSTNKLQSIAEHLHDTNLQRQSS